MTEGTPNLYIFTLFIFYLLLVNEGQGTPTQELQLYLDHFRELFSAMSCAPFTLKRETLCADCKTNI